VTVLALRGVDLWFAEGQLAADRHRCGTHVKNRRSVSRWIGGTASRYWSRTVGTEGEVTRDMMLPLSGAWLVILLVTSAVKLFALVDAATRPAHAFAAAGKQTKQFWLVLLAAAVFASFLGFLMLIGLVAALVYLADVRPAIKDVPRGGSSQRMGPYGPW
jgi:hypothetical protein